MRTPALEQLMGAYLHQDYGFVGDIRENVDAFMVEDSRATLLTEEIPTVLARFAKEEDLEAFLVSLGCDVAAGPGGYRGMLKDIAAQVAEGEAGLRRRQEARGPFPGTRPPRHTSTFPDEETAEAAVGELLTRNARDFECWVADGPDERLVLRGVADQVIGRSADGLTQKIVDVRGVHVVLLRGPDYPDGWAIHNAYPVPEESLRPGAAAPALAHLLGGYFHQDWDHDYADQTEAVRDFLLGSPSWAPLVADEIDSLLHSVPDETELVAHLDALGCEFATRAGAETYRGWLLHVAEQCRAATAAEG